MKKAKPNSPKCHVCGYEPSTWQSLAFHMDVCHCDTNLPVWECACGVRFVGKFADSDKDVEKTVKKLADHLRRIDPEKHKIMIEMKKAFA